MGSKWSNMNRQGRSLNKLYGWLYKRVEALMDEEKNNGMYDDELILKYVSQVNNTARTIKSVSETASIQVELEELKTIVYNLPEEMLKEVRVKLGK